MRRARPVRAGGARAFTLIEVALALAITLLVVAAVVPLSLSLIERADARAVADRLSAAVRLATADAARRGAVVTLCARERRGLETDLVLQVVAAGGSAGTGAAATAGDVVVDLGVEMPRGWRVEGLDDEGNGRSGPAGERAGSPGGEREASETVTPIGSAFPDGRFVALSVLVTTAERGAAAPPAKSGSNGAGEDDGPPRLAVHVDALNGRVSLEAVQTQEKKAEQPGDVPLERSSGSTPTRSAAPPPPSPPPSPSAASSSPTRSPAGGDAGKPDGAKP